MEAPMQARSVVPKNVGLVLASGDGLECVSNSDADMVLSISVFQHIIATLVKNYLRESYWVLRPAGLLK